MKYRLYREPHPNGDFLGIIELNEEPAVDLLLVSGEMTWSVLDVIHDPSEEHPAIVVRLVPESGAEE